MPFPDRPHLDIQKEDVCPQSFRAGQKGIAVRKKRDAGGKAFACKKSGNLFRKIF